MRLTKFGHFPDGYGAATSGQNKQQNCQLIFSQFINFWCFPEAREQNLKKQKKQKGNLPSL